jgi:cyclophilin family peptidyl-prolyl cis-trans isomerase
LSHELIQASTCATKLATRFPEQVEFNDLQALYPDPWAEYLRKLKLEK